MWQCLLGGEPQGDLQILVVILIAAAVLSDYQYENHLVSMSQSVFCLLQKALVATDATYAPGNGPLTGIVSCEGIDLPVSSTAGQLWATELATLYQTAQDVAQDRARRYCWPAAAAFYSAFSAPAGCSSAA